MKYESEPVRIPCGPTLDETECACGCTAHDERCAYWIWAENHWKTTVPEHTCCRTNPKARLNSLFWPQDGHYVMNSMGEHVEVNSTTGLS